MTSAPSRSWPVESYTVALVCPMGVELAPVKALLDHIHSNVSTPPSQNSYVLGDMAGHHVVVAVLPETGTNAATRVVAQLMNDFPAVRFSLLVGIGGGVPDAEHEDDCVDIRLGDVVVSKPTSRFGGVVQYDLGKHIADGGFEPTGLLNKPPALLRSKVEQLAADHRMQGSKISHIISAMLERYPAMQDEYSRPSADDLLFHADYLHVNGRACRNCDKTRLVERDVRRSTQPKVHYGIIGSANAVVKDAVLREKLRREMNIMCVEMEAAGLMNDFPCLVIRGICDYADSHKSKTWQPYAAAVAAAYAKELLSIIPPIETEGLAPAADVVPKPSKFTRYTWSLRKCSGVPVDQDARVIRAKSHIPRGGLDRARRTNC